MAADSFHVINLGYIPVAALTAAIAAYASIDFAAWRHPRRLVVHTARGVLLGTGVWGMHFIAMRAVIPRGTHYSVPMTAVSVLAPVVLLTAAFALLDRRRATPGAYLAAAGLSAAGIVAMHLLGMFALHTTSHATWHFPALLAAGGVAFAASLGALTLLQFLPAERAHSAPVRYSLVKLGASTLLAAAITGMHLIGMHAYTIDTVLGRQASGVNERNVALLVLSVVLLLCVMSQALLTEQRARDEDQQWLRQTQTGLGGRGDNRAP